LAASQEKQEVKEIWRSFKDLINGREGIHISSSTTL